MFKLLSKAKHIPRWLILFADVLIAGIAFSVSYFIILKIADTAFDSNTFLPAILAYVGLSAAVFWLMRIHTGLIRYTNSEDMLRIFTGVFLCSLLFCAAYLFVFPFKRAIAADKLALLLLISFSIKSSVMVMLRTMVRSIYFYLKFNSSANKKSILIYGTTHNSLLLKQALEATRRGDYHVAGFIELNSDKVNRFIEQRKVYPLEAISRLKNRLNIQKLIIPDDKSISNEAKQLVIEKCLQAGVRISTVPSSHQLLADEGLYNHIKLKNLKIEDLLSRQPISIDDKAIFEELSSKRILITGAAGSIGSEITRQVLKYNPAQVALCDQAESPLHDLQMEINDLNPQTTVDIFIADVRNYRRMRALFKQVRPEIVFHAAAYKHVPLMENYPAEAIQTNVLGTKNVADLAVHFDAAKFVMVSTDKAVNPTNIMGASKRIAEIYVQSLNEAITHGYEHLTSVADFYRSDASTTVNTRFITTRFGNVLGSNGSVIPRFATQIKKGGPVTVTHPEITRYFMTIPEAVQLVLEAGATLDGGKILVFDMGEPVKIADLADKMIRLSGYIPGNEIKIIYTGLRPGEKLYEELLNKHESTQPTHHEKIKIANVGVYDYKDVVADIDELIKLASKDDHNAVVRKMKKMVPEYLSNNSEYEKFDVGTAKVN
ncbi:polysaccharide biosynthesis protein [Mucilaginibacter limnophilus]|uniref:Polysaccharide biosynthesis protein n=1 Tax=Mucilaginibacter limnophilus TaxID=1932778 RepID=A0A3S2UNV0_9SPHI|nr:nucleoside-diphosphate sugar epimerase/dehydratase [Mucilaginibacter limnophilus]RVU00711.1 polysaccharide biosynthesis protein [Mucilaginibacter limnophilus]